LKIRKAVIAVAGYGTRFLPATKVQPKELLPIVDKPVIQYLVEEVVASGIKDIILATRSGMHGIADHFDSSRELEVYLHEHENKKSLDLIKAIPKMANFAVVRQGRHLPYGNGTPLLTAKDYLDKDEPFVYLFGDDLVMSDVPCVKQLIDAYERYEPDAVIAVQEMPFGEMHSFGMVNVKKGSNPKEVEEIVEKPDRGTARSNLAQFGRFILPWRIIEILESIHVAKGKELYLTEANNILCREGRMLAHTVEGTWLTAGDPLSFLKTNVYYALRNPEIGKDFAEFLKSLNL
jgi:UTP--glucose-1-phosphate uridylyltransferase